MAKKLAWSRMQTGILNGKIAHLTMVTVGKHTADGDYVVSPKLLPGKAMRAKSELEAVAKAESLYAGYMSFLTEELPV